LGTHTWERCRDWGIEPESWQHVVGWVLGKAGEGEEWMRRLEKEREEIGETGRLGDRRGGGGNRNETEYERVE